MGGLGSGRTGARGTRGIAENYCSIDVRKWHRQGLLVDGQRFSAYWSIGLSASLHLTARVEAGCLVAQSSINSPENEPQKWSQTIFIDWTPCHFGGERPWFICPTRGCDKRVAILYFAGPLACRHCCNLAYDSQRQSSNTRASNRVNKTRAKLGWKPGFLNGVEWKPKGMHWDTFGRLLKQHEEEVAQAKIQLVSSLGLKWWEDDPFS